MPVVVGIDIGSSGLKALALGPEGRPVALSNAPTPFHRAATGAEMSSTDLTASLKKILWGLEIDLRAVGAVGIAGMAEAGAGVDRNGVAVTPIPAWFDTRGEADVRLAARAVLPDIWRATGRPLRPKSSLALAAGLHRQGYTFRRWMGVPELVLYALTHEICTEPSLASRTGAYNLRSGEYDERLLNAFNLPSELFPRVMGTGAAMGTTGTTFSRDVGLADDVPVTIAGHDHPVGVIALKADDSDTVDSIGTAEQIYRHQTDMPDIDHILDVGLELSAAPNGGWAITGSRRRPGIELHALAHWLGRDRDWLEAAPPRHNVASSTQRGELSTAMRSGTFDALSALLRDDPRATWNEAIRDLAMDAAKLIENTDDAVGRGRRLILTGGGTRSTLMVAAKSRIASVPVIVTDLPHTTALGAAITATDIV